MLYGDHTKSHRFSTLQVCGISLDSVDDDKRSALWHAAANGNSRLMEALLSRGAPFNRLDAYDMCRSARHAKRAALVASRFCCRREPT